MSSEIDDLVVNRKKAELPVFEPLLQLPCELDEHQHRFRTSVFKATGKPALRYQT